MNEMIKKPYKITLWEDRNKYIYQQDQTIQNQYLEEVCIATIGSDQMDTPIRAFNPILTEDLNGSKSFTFQIYSKYWDDKDEVFKDNPFINLLVNERKVKLKYNDEWYDFVIKQVQENSENYVFSYTCKDLFINELGKTGYEVELNTELQNNMGTITELGNAILEGTDWQVGECDLLIQRNKEALYSYIVPSLITGVKKFQNGSSVDNIAAGQVLLVFYSSKVNSESPTQFLYKHIGNYSTVDEAIADFYTVDEYGFVVDGENLEATLPAGWENSLVPTKVFGQKIIKKQETHYIPQIEETCGVYIKNGTRYYAYTELEYASVAEIQSMLSNGCGFISTNSWVGSTQLSSVGTDSAIQMSGTVYNTGFYDNRAVLSPRGFVSGEKYVLMVKHSGGSITNGSYVRLLGNGGVSDRTILTFNTSISTSGSNSIVSNFSEKNNYVFYSGTCASTVNYSTILSDYGDIRFYLGFSGTLNLIDCKVFKYRLDSNGKLIIPDLQEDSDSIIKTRYNFFLESEIPQTAYYTKQDLDIAESLLEDEIDAYHPVYSSNCEKVTSITGSKSNRFNLIQSLCEAFECWAKLTIEHNEKGQILYEYILISPDEYVESGRYYQRIDGGSGASSDDSKFSIYNGSVYTSGLYRKSYHKYIQFKEYIGDDNPVGFRYGINLKSIQRNLVSDQIATKVIVQPNANEFAPNGYCTIQQSVLNPTGENAIYNFQYFINHGLLDGTALNDDLYGINGGLGFFTNMKRYNDLLNPKIDQKIEIGTTLNVLESRQYIYDSLIAEAKKLRTEIYNDCVNAGYSISGATTGNEVPDVIKKYREEYKTYNGTVNYYEDLSRRNNILLIAYNQKYAQIESEEKAVRALKDQLNDDFENKYYRFIQEGTWTSNDYYDPELYYQAADMVLYTSSFPQVSYTINVLEISEIEGFELYQFKIADKTYVEDTEFFGYDKNGRPYKEEIVISQVKYNLDDPSQNTITVQNYKTQFQDLFQRMAASSQILQYNEGVYNRAAGAINNDGTINSALMQNTLKDNALIIQNAKNQSVVWDDTGITISNYLNANEIVRLTSTGIALTTDGGRSWTTGITGSGVNADVITAGRIDTDRIRIFNKNMQQTFEWNDKGINAYMWDSTIGTGAVNYGQFVRFDKYGLYGYNGGNPNWNPSTISDVISSSIFSLTWNGLSINIPPNSQTAPVITVGPSNNPVFQVSSDGTLKATSGEISGTLIVDGLDASQVTIDGTAITNTVSGAPTEQIQAAYLNLKGITVKNSSNTTTFQVDSSGNVKVSGNITMTGGNITWNNINESDSAAYTAANEAYSLADDAADDILDLVNGSYSGGTFINGTSIYSPTIISNEFNVKPETSNSIAAYKVWGYFNGNLMNYFQIYGHEDVAPVAVFECPHGEYMYFNAGEYIFAGSSVQTDFAGNVTIHGNLRVYGTITN